MVSNTIEVKLLNKEKIREAVQKFDCFTKADVAKETDLSIATCSSILNEMEKQREIIQNDQTEGSIGRPAKEYSYNPDFQHVLICCINADTVQNSVIKLEIAVADALGRRTSHDIREVEFLDYKALESILASFIEADSCIQAIGIGIPGVVENGVITKCDIPSFEQVDIAGSLGTRFSVVVIAENDVNFMAYALYNSSDNPKVDLAAMYFPARSGGCVGSGIICNGRILKGNTTFAGELSYIAEIFGISREVQRQLYLDKEAFIPYIAKMIMALTCTINPATIVLLSSGISDQDLQPIYKLCEAVISRRHIPALVVENDIMECYIKGLIQLTLKAIQFRLHQ